jgi:putative hydrolase of the HAD superfamily
MQVKAVLFDLFDTLLLIDGNSEEGFYEPSLKKLHEFLENKGIKIAYEEFKHTYFEVRDRLYEETKATLEEPHFNIRVVQTLKELGHDFALSDKIVTGATAAFAKELTRYVELDKDAMAVLQELKKHYKLGLVSNFAIPECLHKLLEIFNLTHFFDAVTVSGTINRRKPHPEIFQKTLTALNVKPSEAAFVGDTRVADIKGAKDAGILAILIERDSSPVEISKSLVWTPPKEKKPIVPDKVIKRLSELPIFFREHLAETDNNVY